MNEQDIGIKKETISFYPMETTTPKTVKIKVTLSGSSFKLQLPIFNQGNAEDFLYFLHEFNEARTKLGYNICPKLESGLKQLLPKEHTKVQNILWVLIYFFWTFVSLGESPKLK